jgi:uncharacterized Zn finger protein
MLDEYGDEIHRLLIGHENWFDVAKEYASSVVIERGLDYAKRNMVKNLHSNNGVIYCEVLGSLDAPYEIQMGFDIMEKCPKLSMLTPLLGLR